MTLPMTYSRRKRIREQAGADPQVRNFPIGHRLLTQLFQLFLQIDQHLYSYAGLVTGLVTHVRQEKGVLALTRAEHHLEEFHAWWMSEGPFPGADHDLRLDCIELATVIPFLIIREHVATDPSIGYSAGIPIRETISTINARMLEDGFGFQLDGDQLVEVSSQFLHGETIEPTLHLLSNAAFAAADTEFRDALAEFRAGKYDDCIADWGNAFESVLKVIAQAKQWPDLKPTDRASQMIEAAYRNGLIPAYMQSQFSGLRQVLMGAPTIRNNEGGYGAGTQPRQVPRHLAAYQLHQTAAAILFLADCADLR
jgi:hypothetical protein